MTADELIALNDQIAGMARAGLPLDQGLAGLAKEMGRGRLRRVTEGIARDLQAGATLPDAVARREKELPPFYAHLLTAGIRTGRLPEVLATLSAYARTVAATRAIVIDALFYPAVVVALSSALFLTLVFVILPQFDQIFRDFQMKLPAVTEFFLAVGRNPVPALVVPAAGAALGLAGAWAVLRATGWRRLVWARVVYAVPVVGGLIRAARLAAFADLLAVLVEFELPLPEAFRLAGEASSDPLMAAHALKVEARLADGVGLGEALHGRGLLPQWVAWMAETGAKRGSLAPALRQIAALYRRQVDSRAALLRSVLPSFVILATAAGLVGVFGLTIMLPLVKLLEGLSK